MFEVEIAEPSRAGSFGHGPATGAAVAGLGVALPSIVKGNEPIAERLGVEPDWITARTGVIERRVAAEEETLVDYAVAAGEAALADAELDPATIDLVLVATASAEMLCPAAAPVVAGRLGTDHAGAMDINAACSGFLSCVSMATAQIEAGRAKNALVIGADLMHRMIDMDDRGTAGLFADGSGAIVMRASEGDGRIGPILLASDGDMAHLVEASREEGIIRMKGHDTFRQAVDRLTEVTAAAVAASGLEIEQVNLFAYHQANTRIIEAVGQRLGLNRERVIDCVSRFGNTSAASIPIALNEARSEDRLRSGDKVLIGAFGGGLTWGATVIEWGSSR